MRSAEPVEIGVDGEALNLQPPLHFVIRPGALTVRLPRTAPGRSPAARTVRVTARPTVTALWQTVLGRPMGPDDQPDSSGTGRGTARRPPQCSDRDARPSRAVRLLRRLGRVDRAAYRAVAEMSTPLLDGPLRQVSDFANFSKPWFLVAGVLALFGGARGRRAALTGVAAIGLTSFVVNQPMKLAGERAPPGPHDPGRPREPLGADAVVDLVPLRPLGIGSSVRRRGRGRATQAQAAAAGGRRGCDLFSRLHRRPLPR